MREFEHKLRQILGFFFTKSESDARYVKVGQVGPISTNEVNSLTNYTAGTDTAEIAVADTLNQALAKLQAQLRTIEQTHPYRETYVLSKAETPSYTIAAGFSFLMVYLDGVLTVEGTTYDVSGNKITFKDKQLKNSVIDLVYYR